MINSKLFYAFSLMTLLNTQNCAITLVRRQWGPFTNRTYT